MKTPKKWLGFALILVAVLGGGLVTASAHDGYYRHHRHHPARVVVVSPVPPVYAYGYYYHPYPRHHRAYVYPEVRPGVRVYYGPRYHHDHHHGWR